MFSGTTQDVDETVERKESKKERDKGRYVAFYSDDEDIAAQGDDESLAPSSSSIRTKSKKSKKEKPVKPSKKKIKIKKQEKSKIEKEKEKVKDKKKDKKNESPKRQVQVLPVFGVTLEEAVQRSMLPDGVQLPRIIRECIMQIEDRGLAQEGIYRLSGVKSKIETLKELYNQGKSTDLEEYEPNILAGLIKLFIRELTDSILPEEIAQPFEEAAAMPNRQEKINQFKNLILELPVPNRTLLSWLMVHMLHVLQKGSENKMSIQSIGIVLHPTTGIAQPVLNVLLNNISTLFGDTTLTRYEHLPTPEVDISSLSAPEEISAELARQEEILAKLHEDMKKGSPDETDGKDEELWAVQRKVTMLKRKLRVAKRKQEAVVDETKRVEEQKKQEDNIPPTEEDAEEETLKRLELEEMELRFEEEELLEVRDQLEKRLQNEKNEIKRLEEAIAEVNENRANNSGVASDQNSSSASDNSESEEDESELEEIMNDLVQHNEELEEKNQELVKQIHEEQETCVELKVQIKMLTATQQVETEKPS